MSDEIHVIIPGRSEGDFLSDKLRELTRELAKKTETEMWGGLGGDDGYGIDYENKVFMMHRYCWCESEDCPWCGRCECEPRYLRENKELTWEEWSEFHKQHPRSKEESFEEFYKRHHLEVRVDKECSLCKGEKHKESGAIPGQWAPNFWHKESELRVWWYKWIGRDMEIYNPKHVSTGTIFKECLESL